jgi:hypothetical protein
MSNEGPWVTKTILELEDKIAQLKAEITELKAIAKLRDNPTSRQSLEVKPFTWVFTDVNGKANEIAGDPVHRSPQDLRIYTALYTHPAGADGAKHHAVMQAQIWAQEARTQKAIVKEIGELVGCANDWEMVEAVRDALANVCVSQSAESETQTDLSLIDAKQSARSSKC